MRGGLHPHGAQECDKWWRVAGDKAVRGEIMHYVRTTDTLVGLSLRYGVSSQRIREVNSIMGTSIVQYSSLIIPPDETSKCSKRKPRGTARSGAAENSHRLRNLDEGEAASVQQRRIIALRREMALLGGGSEKETAAYLSMADDDTGTALKMFKEDLEWQSSAASSQVLYICVCMYVCVYIYMFPYEYVNVCIDVYTNLCV